MPGNPVVFLIVAILCVILLKILLGLAGVVISGPIFGTIIAIIIILGLLRYFGLF